MSNTNFNIESSSGFTRHGFTLQQTPSSNLNSTMINLVSNHVIPASHPISTFGSAKPQSFKPVMQPLVPLSLPGGTGALLGDVASQHLLGKRKSPTESTARGVLAHNLYTTQKRMASNEHRPWLQSISEANKGTVQIQASSAFPGVQHLPSLSKSTVHLESVLSKPGKQVATTKQYTQKQPLPKPQNASFESVRSKMKESLASALALVQQQGESLKDEKASPSKNPILPVESQVDSQSHESAISTSELDATVSECNSIVISSRKECFKCFNQNESNKQTMICETSVACKKSDSKICEGQESESIYPFPLEDISFGNDVLGDNDLLQGDLSWVLDSEIVFGDERDIEVPEVAHCDEAKQERTKRKLLQDPQLLAFKIEAELFRLFGGVNKKYKEKGRSLLFNLKDKYNPELREKVMHGDIPPERLCSMSAEELASKELSEWRQAKAEKMAQMVVLPDTEVDIRRLVRKTHKGEYQVDVEQVDGESMEVSVGSSSLSWSQLKNDVKRTTPTSTAKTTVNKNERKDTKKTITSTNEVSDPMQGITVDDDIKDAVGVLPPIVSLDEFMQSQDSEPPVGNSSADAATVLDKSDSENGGNLKSLEQITADPVNLLPAESGSIDAGTSKMDSNIESPCSDIKSKTSGSVVIPTWDHVWEGVLQLSVSSAASVTSFFKSGERTSAKEWPGLLEIKGRVRLNAFDKFLQELPKSRSRAVMVMYFVSKEDSPKSGRSRLYEEAESYDSEGRVGYVEPVAEVELYLCPTTGKTADVLGNIVPKDQIDFFKSLNNALIGVVVWRRRPELTTASINKHNFTPKTQPHKYGYMNHQEKDINVAKSVTMSVPMSHHHHHTSIPHPNVEDDDGDDVPPGFGPGDVHRDDDDLPEFNFASQTPVRPPQSVNQARELIHRYGRPKPSWNNVDDDDDMPEWQPQARLNNGQMVNQADVRMQQQGVWWAHQARSRRGF